MSKDRAAPFSRKHRRYWLPVTGGMLLIGAINLALGYWAYDPPSPSAPQKIELVIPPSPYASGASGASGAAGAAGVPDAGVDAAAASAAPPPPVTPR